MRNTKSLVVFIFLFANVVMFRSNVIAQRSTSIQGQQTYFNKFANNLDRIKSGESRELPVGYYLYEEWKNGAIYAQPNVDIQNLQLKYCVLNQEFEFISDNDTFSITNPILVDSIKFNDKCFIYTNYSKSNQVESTYFELLSSKGYMLLQKYDCKFVKGKKNVSSFEEPTDDSYLITTRFYLKENDGPALLLPKSKKSFFNTFGNRKDEVKKFMKVNKLKRSSSEDLSKILTYYYYLNTKS